MLTTVGDKCGIAAYSSDLVLELNQLVDLDIVKIDSGMQSVDYYRAQAERLNTSDVIHIQHLLLAIDHNMQALLAHLFITGAINHGDMLVL